MKLSQLTITEFLSKYKSIKRNKTFWSITLSYFVLSSLIIAINLPITYINTATITKQNSELNTYILTENATELSKSVTALQNVAISTLYNSNLSGYLPKGKRIMNIDYLNAEKIASIIDTACKSSGQNNIHVAIYLEDHASFITEQGVLSDNYFFKHNINIDNADKQEYTNSILNNNQNYFKFGNYLFFPCSWMEKTGIYVLSYISLDEFMPRIENFNNKTNHHLVMVNKNESVIIADKDMKDFDLSKYSQKQNDKLYISTSSPNNWKYYMIFDNNLFNASINKIWLLVILNLLIELILTAILTMFFSNKNYNPIREIRQIISKGSNLDNENDDFEYIKQGIAEIVKENLSTSKKLHSIKNIDDLRNLIFGRGDDLAHLPIQDIFTSSSFCTALILPDTRKIEEMKSSGFSNENIDIIFINIFEEIISKYYRVCVFNIYDKYCCIINGDNISNSILENSLYEAISLIENHFDIEMYISVSTMTDNITDLHICYNNAIDMLSLMQTIETKKIMFGVDFENIKNVKFDATAAKKILNCINTNQPDMAYNLFEKEINNSINNVHTKMMLEQTVYGAISLLEYLLNNLSIDKDSIFYEKNNPYHQLLPFSNINTLLQKAKKYISTLTLIVQENKSVSTSIETEIKQFIDNNYTNCELSATLISDHFNIKTSSLSLLFKKTYNIGMLDYITNLRIQKAKELLENSALSLDEISDSVGYSNTRSFFRAFKRITGNSPRKDNSNS